MVADLQKTTAIVVVAAVLKFTDQLVSVIERSGIVLLQDCPRA